MIAKKVFVEVLPLLGKDPYQYLHSIVQAYTDYKIVAAEERTKQNVIKAYERTIITQIKANRDVLIKYLEYSFDERVNNFRLLFEKVDRAITDGDNHKLALALDSITEIAKSSPFKDLADLTSVKAALDNPDHEWNF